MRIRLVLANQGSRKAAIYPAAAKLSDVISNAGVGISWQLRFRGPDGPVPQQELRQWHGPPGNPPSPVGVKQATELVLAPGATHEAGFAACWIPAARLTPAHLDPLTLDPTGLDNIRNLPLERASLLVFGCSRAQLEPLMASRTDFLRAGFSTVAAFFPGPGDYQLDAAYLQQSWMDIGDKLTAEAPATSISIG